MRKKRALDLFCGAGGASMGLYQAGFDVTGVDLNPQPEYPFTFVQKSVLDLSASFLADFDLIWASPPCQKFTAYKRRPAHVKEALNLIADTRHLLKQSCRPYIIENVTGARRELIYPTMLCGSMFGLDVQRHRLFETSGLRDNDSLSLRMRCDHSVWTARFPQATNRANKRKTVEVGVWRIPLATQRKAMGINWMSVKPLSQAIPPAYAKWLAEQL